MERRHTSANADDAKAKSQLERFKETAKQVETDDSEEHFDQRLKKVAKPPPPKQNGARK